MSKVIKCGIQYYNSNESFLTEQDKAITNVIRNNAKTIESTEPYEERLNLWRELNLNNRTEHWIGDFTKVKPTLGGYLYPEPALYVSVYPVNFEQVIKFNLTNINIAIEELGDFTSYSTDYLSIIHGQESNPLTELKIRQDLNLLKRNANKSTFIKVRCTVLVRIIPKQSRHS